jgi:hypothetical protein
MSESVWRKEGEGGREDQKLSTSLGLERVPSTSNNTIVCGILAAAIFSISSSFSTTRKEGCLFIDVGTHATRNRSKNRRKKQK